MRAEVGYPNHRINCLERFSLGWPTTRPLLSRGHPPVFFSPRVRRIRGSTPNPVAMINDRDCDQGESGREPTRGEENYESSPGIFIRLGLGHATQRFGLGLRATVGFRGDGSVSALGATTVFSRSEIDEEDGRVAEAEHGRVAEASRGCRGDGLTRVCERTKRKPLQTVFLRAESDSERSLGACSLGFGGGGKIDSPSDNSRAMFWYSTWERITGSPDLDLRCA